MPDLHDRIYLATIAADAADTAHRFDLGLELDEFCTAMNLDEDFPEWDMRVRKSMNGIRRCILHAPFAELHPCAIDPKVRLVARERFERCAELCRRYGASGMVVHSGFIPLIYFPEWFVEQSAMFFRDFLKDQPENFRLFIENVLDPEPSPLLDLVQAIGDSRAALCLDVGHAHAVSKIPVREWLRVLGPHLGHLHLHDNDGSADRHLLPGDGTIGFPDLLDEIRLSAPGASLTFECLDARSCAERLVSFGVIKV